MVGVPAEAATLKYENLSTLAFCTFPQVRCDTK